MVMVCISFLDSRRSFWDAKSSTIFLVLLSTFSSLRRFRLLIDFGGRNQLNGPFECLSGTTGVSVWKKELAGSDIQAAKATGTVAASIEDVLKVCHVTTDKQAIEQDADTLAWRIVKST
jgi:hypothetical protein